MATNCTFGTKQSCSSNMGSSVSTSVQESHVEVTGQMSTPMTALSDHMALLTSDQYIVCVDRLPLKNAGAMLSDAVEWSTPTGTLPVYKTDMASDVLSSVVQTVHNKQLTFVGLKTIEEEKTIWKACGYQGIVVSTNTHGDSCFVLPPKPNLFSSIQRSKDATRKIVNLFCEDVISDNALVSEFHKSVSLFGGKPCSTSVVVHIVPKPVLSHMPLPEMDPVLDIFSIYENQEDFLFTHVKSLAKDIPKCISDMAAWVCLEHYKEAGYLEYTYLEKATHDVFANIPNPLMDRNIVVEKLKACSITGCLSTDCLSELYRPLAYYRHGPIDKKTTYYRRRGYAIVMAAVRANVVNFREECESSWAHTYETLHEYKSSVMGSLSALVSRYHRFPCMASLIGAPYGTAGTQIDKFTTQCIESKMVALGFDVSWVTCTGNDHVVPFPFHWMKKRRFRDGCHWSNGLFGMRLAARDIVLS